MVTPIQDIDLPNDSIAKRIKSAVIEKNSVICKAARQVRCNHLFAGKRRTAQMVYLLLLIGFVLLVKGADYFVSGSSSIAGYFNIPAFIIGLTIVACGTSLPEAAISVTAALRGANGITMGNAVGSNLFNLMVALGTTALIKPCPVAKSTLRFEYPLSILAAGLIMVLCLNGNSTGFILSRLDGLVLLIILIVFLMTTIRRITKGRENQAYDGSVSEFPDDEDVNGSQAVSLPKAALYVVFGVAGIILGGDLVVDSATEIAQAFGIDETLIGLTVVAFGTSLPELVTSTVAAVKGETDIAVGNVIGSNLFNLLLVLGLSVSIHPIQVSLFAFYDLTVLIVVSLIILIPLVRKQALTRGWGVLLLLLYGVYLAYIIMRTM